MVVLKWGGGGVIVAVWVVFCLCASLDYRFDEGVRLYTNSDHIWIVAFVMTRINLFPVTKTCSY